MLVTRTTTPNYANQTQSPQKAAPKQVGFGDYKLQLAENLVIMAEKGITLSKQGSKNFLAALGATRPIHTAYEGVAEIKGISLGRLLENMPVAGSPNHRTAHKSFTGGDGIEANITAVIKGNEHKIATALPVTREPKDGIVQLQARSAVATVKQAILDLVKNI